MLHTFLLGPMCLMCKVVSKWRQMIKQTKLLTEVPAFGEISFFQMFDIIKGELGAKGKNDYVTT